MKGALFLALLWGCSRTPSEPAGSSSVPPPSSATATASQPSAKPAPSVSPVPGVPSLLPGESPPTKGPNYFEPHEMGAGGISAAFQSCESSAMNTDAPLPADKVALYCACIVDAWRTNTHDAPGPADVPPPSKTQVQQCGVAVRAGQPSPFAFAYPKITQDILNSVQGCLELVGQRDHGLYCGCFVDGTLKTKGARMPSPADQKRCELADRYYDATKTRPTLRQFQGITP